MQYTYGSLLIELLKTPTPLKWATRLEYDKTIVEKLGFTFDPDEWVQVNKPPIGIS